MAGAIKGKGVVKKLFLFRNHIGDAGAAAFADALRINGARLTVSQISQLVACVPQDDALRPAAL